jgi:hypothetical protein
VQAREIAETTAMLEALLRDTSRTRHARVLDAVRGFFHTEAAESRLRQSLHAAEAWLPDTPALTESRTRLQAVLAEFLRAGAPGSERRDFEFEASVILTVVSRVAESVTSRTLPDAELERWADTIATMLLLRFPLQD